MNKSELVDAMADRAGVTKNAAGGCLEVFLDIVCEQVAAGKEVNVTGHMKFSPVQRSARVGRNPQTGETIEVPATKAVRITPGAKLKAAVKG